MLHSVAATALRKFSLGNRTHRLTWKLYPALTGFERHSEDWDALNGTLHGGHPFLDTRFVVPLLENFGGPNVVLATRDDGTSTPVSMVLLVQRRFGIWTTFLPSQAQIAPAVLAPSVDLSGLFVKLGWENLILELLCQDPEHSPFNGAQNLHRAAHVKTAETISVTIQGSFEEYWGNRSKNLRKSISRRLSKWQDRIEFIEHTETEHILKALGRYGDLESQGWKGKEGTAIHRGNLQGQFYSEVLSRFGDSGHAAIHELYVDGKLGSSQITLTNGQMLVMLKTTFDETLSDCAPGRLLQYLLLERIFEEKRCDRVEYYTNANADQIGWCTEHRPINHVMVFRYSWAKHLWIAYRRLRRT